jgi:hypothetical protein
MVKCSSPQQVMFLTADADEHAMSNPHSPAADPKPPGRRPRPTPGERRDRPADTGDRAPRRRSSSGRRPWNARGRRHPPEFGELTDTPRSSARLPRRRSDGCTRYAHTQGIPLLREAIARHYATRYGGGVLSRSSLLPGRAGHAPGLLGVAGPRARGHPLRSPLCVLPEVWPLAEGRPCSFRGRERRLPVPPDAVRERRTEDQGHRHQLPGQSHGDSPERMAALPGPGRGSSDDRYGLTYGVPSTRCSSSPIALVFNGFSKALR